MNHIYDGLSRRFRRMRSWQLKYVYNDATCLHLLNRKWHLSPARDLQTSPQWMQEGRSRDRSAGTLEDTFIFHAFHEVC